MEFDLQAELEIFEKHLRRPWKNYEVQSMGPSMFRLKPRSLSKQKLTTLGFMALVHGNEVLGLPVLNALIQSLEKGEIESQVEIYFALGNVPAALADKRFLEEDLNRSFGLNSFESREALRARELEKGMLDHCDYLIDLHQTGEAAKNAFFIFQYTSPRCLAFLSKINSSIPTIVQLDPIGDNTGLASDEYVRNRGGFGTTLELGMAGVSEAYFQLGLSTCEKVIATLNEKNHFSQNDFDFSKKLSFPLYQLSYRFKITEEGTELHPGWENLQNLRKGEAVGQSGSQTIYSPVSGFMVFPRYSSVGKVGQNLFYVCTKVDPKDLPVPQAWVESHPPLSLQ